MEFIKKNVAPTLLLTLGVLMVLMTAMKEALTLFSVGFLWKAEVMWAFAEFCTGALFIMVAFVAKGYYTKSLRLLAYVKGLKIAAFVFCAMQVWSGAKMTYFDIFKRKYNSTFTLPFQVATDILIPVAVITAFALVIDLLSEYMELKAESSLTI